MTQPIWALKHVKGDFQAYNNEGSSWPIHACSRFKTQTSCYADYNSWPLQSLKGSGHEVIPIINERVWTHVVDCPPVFFTRETTFVTSCLLSYASASFWKWGYSKRKEFAPIGSKFFSFRVDLFLEGRQTPFKEYVVIPLDRKCELTLVLLNKLRWHISF